MAEVRQTATSGESDQTALPHSHPRPKSLTGGSFLHVHDIFDITASPVTAVQVPAVSFVWRDSVTTGMITITCMDKNGAPVPNVPVILTVEAPGIIIPATESITLTATSTGGATGVAEVSLIVAEPAGGITAHQVSPSVGTRAVYLGVGSQTGNFADSGIIFSATGGVGGTLNWAQILVSKTATITDFQKTPIQIYNQSTPGLDHGYPYGAANATQSDDSPDVPDSADRNLEEINVTGFDAKMYLMWTSNAPSSISIPISVVEWTWKADATFDNSGKGTLVSASGSADYVGVACKIGVLSWLQTAPGLLVNK